MCAWLARLTLYVGEWLSVEGRDSGVDDDSRGVENETRYSVKSSAE